ncbi:hypothetical protein LSUE1_G009089 [Lachnellula suecica]|uniref:Uncharacterized protein n=1 Tax=Lachnellula suecica TaxID=602035 RepID=A0A8T9C592_9HELO|nr:hypothetical protein LSUE1_G009089 [Lachnellula suecica]
MHLLQRQESSSTGSSTQASSTTEASTTISSTSTPISTTSTPSATVSPPPHPHNQTSNDNSKPPYVGIIIGCIAAVLGLLLLFFVIRQARIKNKSPKYIPKPFKKLWQKWEPGPSHARLPDGNGHLEPISTTHPNRSPRSGQPPVSSARGAANNGSAPGRTTSTTSAGIDRNTSVRSVMTLPAYNPAPHQNEQILGREGERGGIDVVLEFPETVDEEEQHREAEMEALYQVRLARRRENEEREERRRERREARERGDYVALREIQARARASSSASAGRTVEELRAEHERVKKERQRAVSSVSYGDLGVARHDGTRLRANSVESEREGLLGDAASIAASSHYHRRDRSASSVLSIDTMNSDFPSPGLTRSRANSRPDSPFGRTSTRQSHGPSNAGSSPEMIEHEDAPPNSPPGYENISLETPHPEQSHSEPPPDYSSPVVDKGEHRTSTHIGQLMSAGSSSRGVGGSPQLPSLRLSNLPSIQVEASSPVVRSTDERL